MRRQLEKLPAKEPAACAAANRRLDAFQPEINAVIEKLDYKRRSYAADLSVTHAWTRVIKITKGSVPEVMIKGQGFEFQRRSRQENIGRMFILVDALFRYV